MKPKLLANENFPAPSVGYLRNCGFDVLCIAEDAVFPTHVGMNRLRHSLFE